MSYRGTITGPIDLKDPGTRLSVYQKTKLDYIKDSVAKPGGYLPPKSLPTWQAMAIEQKLPLLPAPPGTLYFTRGHLTKSLLREGIKTKTEYTTLDPLNHERIPSDIYESLHDPMNRLNMNEPVMQLLKGHDHINEKGEVICSLKEFNRYRKYLAALYNERVRNKVATMDELEQFQRATAKALFRQELYERGQGRDAVRDMRVAKSRAFMKIKADNNRARMEIKMKLENDRILHLEQDRVRLQTEKTLKNEEKQQMQQKRMEEKEAREKQKIKNNLHRMTLKDLQSRAHRGHVKKERVILNEQKQTRWFEAKVFSAAERLQREKQVQEFYDSDIKRKADIRQKNVERMREELPLRIAQRKVDKQRLENIVKRFAIRWLNRVRQRLNRPRDETHESLWYSDYKNSLVDGVKYLYANSGYEKLDDVVANILKFKEALKKQLLIEDGEEEDEDYDDEE